MVFQQNLPLFLAFKLQNENVYQGLRLIEVKDSMTKTNYIQNF